MKKKATRTFRFGKYKGPPVNNIIKQNPGYADEIQAEKRRF